MPSFSQGGAGVAPVNEAVVDGDLIAIPAATANGAPLTDRPTGATGVIIYLPTGAAVTYTIASAQPGAAPTLVTEIVAADKAVFEPLGPNTNCYVTVKTGSPFYRWV
jgi:hypothetical protein